MGKTEGTGDKKRSRILRFVDKCECKRLCGCDRRNLAEMGKRKLFLDDDVQRSGKPHLAPTGPGGLQLSSAKAQQPATSGLHCGSTRADGLHAAAHGAASQRQQEGSDAAGKGQPTNVIADAMSMLLNELDAEMADARGALQQLETRLHLVSSLLDMMPCATGSAHRGQKDGMHGAAEGLLGHPTGAMDAMVSRLSKEQTRVQKDLGAVTNRLQVLQYAESEWRAMLGMMKGVSVDAEHAGPLQELIFRGCMERISAYQFTQQKHQEQQTALAVYQKAATSRGNSSHMPGGNLRQYASEAYSSHNAGDEPTDASHLTPMGQLVRQSTALGTRGESSRHGSFARSRTHDLQQQYSLPMTSHTPAFEPDTPPLADSQADQYGRRIMQVDNIHPRRSSKVPQPVQRPPHNHSPVGPGNGYVAGTVEGTRGQRAGKAGYDQAGSSRMVTPSPAMVTPSPAMLVSLQPPHHYPTAYPRQAMHAVKELDDESYMDHATPNVTIDESEFVSQCLTAARNAIFNRPGASMPMPPNATHNRDQHDVAAAVARQDSAMVMGAGMGVGMGRDREGGVISQAGLASMTPADKAMYLECLDVIQSTVVNVQSEETAAKDVKATHRQKGKQAPGRALPAAAPSSNFPAPAAAPVRHAVAAGSSVAAGWAAAAGHNMQLPATHGSASAHNTLPPPVDDTYLHTEEVVHHPAAHREEDDDEFSDEEGEGEEDDYGTDTDASSSKGGYFELTRAVTTDLPTSAVAMNGGMLRSSIAGSSGLRGNSMLRHSSAAINTEPGVAPYDDGSTHIQGWSNKPGAPRRQQSTFLP